MNHEHAKNENTKETTAAFSRFRLSSFPDEIISVRLDQPDPNESRKSEKRKHERTTKPKNHTHEHQRLFRVFVFRTFVIRLFQ